MLKANASAADDQMQNCAQARWRIDGNHADYGISGLDVCARVEKDPGTHYYAWSYFVSCAVKQSQVQGRYNDPETCLEESAHWLREFGCPGNLTKQEKTWKQWAMIGQ